VDTLGLLLLVVVHSTGIQDRDGARKVLAPLANRFTRLACTTLAWPSGSGTCGRGIGSCWNWSSAATR
jgi:hypothetical protein